MFRRKTRKEKLVPVDFPPPYEEKKEKKKTVGELRKELTSIGEKNFEKFYLVYKELLDKKTTTEEITKYQILFTLY